MPKHKATISLQMTKVIMSDLYRGRARAMVARNSDRGAVSRCKRFSRQPQGAISVAVNKLHNEFHTLDMENGWQLPEGYDPKSGAFGEDPVRIARYRKQVRQPNTIAEVPSGPVHQAADRSRSLGRSLSRLRRPDRWQRRKRARRSAIRWIHLRCQAARRMARSVQVGRRLLASRNALLRSHLTTTETMTGGLFRAVADESRSSRKSRSRPL